MTSGSNGLIKFCPVCGKWPQFHKFRPAGSRTYTCIYTSCDCMGNAMQPTMQSCVAAWNARCERLRMARKNGKSHMALGIDGIENEPSENDGRIAGKEEQP